MLWLECCYSLILLYKVNSNSISLERRIHKFFSQFVECLATIGSCESGGSMWKTGINNISGCKKCCELCVQWFE